MPGCWIRLIINVRVYFIYYYCTSTLNISCMRVHDQLSCTMSIIDHACNLVFVNTNVSKIMGSISTCTCMWIR